MFHFRHDRIREVEVEVVAPEAIIAPDASQVLAAVEQADGDVVDAGEAEPVGALEREAVAPATVEPATPAALPPATGTQPGPGGDPERANGPQPLRRGPRPASHASEDERLQTGSYAGRRVPAGPTCQILFWRGYLKGAFYARVFGDDGEPLAIAESPFFRPHGNGVPDKSSKALAAHEELCAQLEQDGWRKVAAGRQWFAATFERRATVAPGRVRE